MSLPPPEGPPGYSRLRIPRPGVGARQQAGYHVNQTPVAPMREETAPTLMQFWRSDSRLVPGRKPPKWAGRSAFWLGLLAALLFWVGIAVQSALFVAVAAPIGVAAVFFALVAIIAAVGRGLGVFGLILAISGSSIFWGWAERTFG